MSNWTPEPWGVTTYGNQKRGIGSQRDGLLLEMAYYSEDNLERAAECVNGCKDIIDPAITVPELVAACEELIAEYRECISTVEFGDMEVTATALLEAVATALAKTGKVTP